MRGSARARLKPHAVERQQSEHLCGIGRTLHTVTRPWRRESKIRGISSRQGRYEMATSDQDAKPDRVERHGKFVISGAATYLADVQMWEPRITIEREEGNALEFVVPCGPECYRKDANDA